MTLKELIFKLRKYPKIIVQYLRDTESPYISIYQLSRLTGIDWRSSKEYMYDLIKDGIIQKYQTTFRMTNDFIKLRNLL